MAKSQTEVEKEERKSEGTEQVNPIRTFILLSGVHYDDEGEHLPDSPTKFVKSTKDLAAAEPQRYAPFIQ